MGGITANLSGCSRFAEYWQFGIVGEDYYEGSLIAKRCLVGETPVSHLDSIHTHESSIRTINIELTLVEAPQATLDAEMSASGAT